MRLLRRAACARPRHLIWATLWLILAAGLRSDRPDAGQGADRRPPAAAPSRLAAHGPAAGRPAASPAGSSSWLRYLQLMRLSGLAMRSVQRLREWVYRPRAAPADGVLRPRHHRPAGQPRHQRHRGRQDALHPGAVRHARQLDRPDRHDGRDGLARLAPDADRAGAGAGGGRHRLAVPAPVGAGRHARARPAQRHQRPDGRIDRRHERAAGQQCRGALRRTLLAHQPHPLHGAPGRTARQRLPAAPCARPAQRGPAGGGDLQLSASARSAPSKWACCTRSSATSRAWSSR